MFFRSDLRMSSYALDQRYSGCVTRNPVVPQAILQRWRKNSDLATRVPEILSV